MSQRKFLKRHHSLKGVRKMRTINDDMTLPS